MLRTLGRIALGAAVGLGIAVAICLVVIVVSEWALSRGWIDRYDDVTLALLMQVILMSAPIIGGWWAWARRGVSHDAQVTDR